jgi:hypothetical protein
MQHGWKHSASAASVFVSVMLFAAQATHAQQTEAAMEKQAADSVANLVKQIRSQNKLPELKRIEDPVLREDACAHAAKGAASWETGTGVVVRNGAVSLAHISYSTSAPSSSAPKLESWVTENDPREPRRFAVGVCLVRTAETPEGKYWIELGTYKGAAQSFFYRTGEAVAHLWSR